MKQVATVVSASAASPRDCAARVIFCWLSGAPLRFVHQSQVVSWEICGKMGYSAKVVYLSVDSGVCSTTANALVLTKSPVSSTDEDMACELPGENSCTALAAQVRGCRRYVLEIMRAFL